MSYPNFPHLAYLASRPGKRGADALQVLQDALLDYYQPQFERAMKKARQKSGRSEYIYTVSFGPSLEKAIRKNRSPESQKFYRDSNWPFSVERNPGRFRHNNIVVYDTHNQFNTHGWVKRKRELPAYQVPALFAIRRFMFNV